MSRITGHKAIEHARANGLTLNKYADPVEDAREGLTPDEAEEIAREDAGLIWIDASDTIKVAGREFPFPADMEVAVEVGQRIGLVLDRGEPDKIEREPCGCVEWRWKSNFLRALCATHRRLVGRTNELTMADHRLPPDDLLKLRRAMVEPQTFIGLLRESLGKALHAAGEIDGPVGRLASEEILRLLGKTAKISRRIEALGKAVER